MFSPRTVLFSLLAAVSAVTAIPTRRATAGITAPASGAAIAPGEAFDFTYNTMADYGVSSYNFTVWIITKPPITAFTPSTEFADGWYLGRWSEPNYPAVSYPVNPPPARLVMPDFSKSPGGWGAGATASNAVVYLTVLEEWAQYPGVLGDRLSFSTVELIYNVTSSS